MGKYRRAGMVAVLAATLALAAACSSSGGTTSSSGSLTASTPANPSDSASASPSGGGATASAGDPITVGVICSCSGPFGSKLSVAEQVVKDWASSVNASGGLHGHPLKLITKDDGSNPGTSVTAVQSLISSHIAALIDLTVLDQTWQKQIDEANIPVIGGEYNVEPYYTDPNWYPTGQTNDSIVYANMATAKAAGGSKVGLLYCAESPQCQQSVAPTKTAANKLGLSLAYSVSISATAPNYTAQCLAAKQAGVDSLLVLDEVTIIIKVAEDCGQQDFHPSYIAEGTGYTNQVPASDALKNTYWAPFPALPYFASGSQVERFTSILDKYSPGLRTNTDSFAMVAVQAWTAALALEKAVNAGTPDGAGTAVTPATVRAGLDTFNKETLDGWSPPLTFKADKPHPVDCWYTGRVQKGKPTLLGAGKLTCS